MFSFSFLGTAFPLFLRARVPTATSAVILTGYVDTYLAEGIIKKLLFWNAPPFNLENSRCYSVDTAFLCFEGFLLFEQGTEVSHGNMLVGNTNNHDVVCLDAILTSWLPPESSARTHLVTCRYWQCRHFQQLLCVPVTGNKHLQSIYPKSITYFKIDESHPALVLFLPIVKSLMQVTILHLLKLTGSISSCRSLKYKPRMAGSKYLFSYQS